MSDWKPRAYLSFGAGVQSTAIAMLAIKRDERLLRTTGGVLPELYLFADTGDEPEALYPHVAEMKALIEASGADFQTVEARHAPLASHYMERILGGLRADDMPLFVLTRDGKGYAPIRRGCTFYYKIAPLRRAACAYYGVKAGKIPKDLPRVQLWLGLSRDEPQRMKVGQVQDQQWAEYRMPLFDMGWERADCINYLVGLGITPRRSACVHCPFHSPAEWREVAKNPADWAKAVALDEAIERAYKEHGCLGWNRKKGAQLRNEPFLTQQGVRLRDLDLTEPDDPQRRLWDNECAGVCGV